MSYGGMNPMMAMANPTRQASTHAMIAHQNLWRWWQRERRIADANAADDAGSATSTNITAAAAVGGQASHI